MGFYVCVTTNWSLAVGRCSKDSIYVVLPVRMGPGGMIPNRCRKRRRPQPEAWVYIGRL